MANMGGKQKIWIGIWNVRGIKLKIFRDDKVVNFPKKKKKKILNLWISNFILSLSKNLNFKFKKS